MPQTQPLSLYVNVYTFIFIFNKYTCSPAAAHGSVLSDDIEQMRQIPMAEARVDASYLFSKDPRAQSMMVKSNKPKIHYKDTLLS